MLEVRDGPEAAILEMEKCANDLKTVVDVFEDELCFRIHDIAAALELSIKYSGGGGSGMGRKGGSSGSISDPQAIVGARDGDKSTGGGARGCSMVGDEWIMRAFVLRGMERREEQSWRVPKSYYTHMSFK
jgi:hypothetical protein